MSSASRNGRRNANRRWAAGDGARLRRARALALERLEDRTLLAALEINGQLADISTLDSVAQAEDFLPASGSSDSQKYTHTDGKTTSNVTFTAAPSNTNNPGFNLDVLSQGGVDWNGLVSAKVTAGLTDASGTIGSAVTVTITGTPAEEGNAVTVYLSVVFDVEDFTWNNATLNLNYSASYTYRGTTSQLALSPYQLGGSGGPGRSGPAGYRSAGLFRPTSVIRSRSLFRKTLQARPSRRSRVRDLTMRTGLSMPILTRVSVVR